MEHEDAAKPVSAPDVAPDGRSPMSETGSPDTLYGRQTEAALTNFGISGRPVDPAVIKAIANIKAAAATANGSEPERSGVQTDMADAIVAAAERIIEGEYADQFPVDVYQTGSGTSTNMNVNEVIATLASRSLGRDVHPNDHVNASQSSNDVIPTAVRMAALEMLHRKLLPALTSLESHLDDRARAFEDVVKAGRTHLMDATPVTLGDEFGGYRAQIAEAIERLEETKTRLAAIPLGGTAVGNGLNASPNYQRRVIENLADRSGLPLRPAAHRFAAQGSHDSVVELSGQTRGAAIALYKIANDIRLLASGPRTGLGELMLAELQAGSSIMPGKVNPVICEVVMQVTARVLGNDATIGFAGTQGNLELNTFQPVIADAILESITLLSGAANDLATKCVAGLRADVARCRLYAESTPALAAALNPLIGYDAATDVVRRAAAEGRTIREVAAERYGLDPSELDRHLDVDNLARGLGSETA